MFRNILLPILVILSLTQVVQAYHFQIGDRVVAYYHTSGIIVEINDYNRTAVVKYNGEHYTEVSLKGLVPEAPCVNGFNLGDRIVIVKTAYATANIVNCYADGSVDLQYDIGGVENRSTKIISKVLTHINGFKAGDRVITDMNMTGVIVEGYQDRTVLIRYDGWGLGVRPTNQVHKIKN
ncbi:MAG: hypothetical protein IT289_00285 [Oligoflexia bacterium]|nr:hypothetical protein [Oligoflexia bacterium]